MNALFHYSILQYVHSQAMDERLNLGIVVYFPDEQRLIFKHPLQLKRLKAAYPSIESTDFLKEDLTYLANKANQAEPSWFKGWLGANLERIIDARLLRQDASALQFGETKTVVRYSDDLEKMANDFYTLYFPSNIWV